MKKNMISVFAVLAAVILTSAVEMEAQNPPSGQRQVRIVKVTDGDTTVVDTVIDRRGPGQFFRGDRMIGHDRIMEWVSRDFSGNELGDSARRVIIIRKGQGTEPLFLHKRSGPSDSLWRQRFRIERKEILGGDTVMAFGDRNGPMFRRFPSHLRRSFAPPVPRVHMIREQHANVINLNDRGIISYKKKKMSGGREKITIIRNEVKESDMTGGQRFVNPQDELIRFDRPGPVRELEIKKAPPGEGRRLLETSPGNTK